MSDQPIPIPSRQRITSWMVLLYIAVSLSILVSKQAAGIATEFNLNPRLFTAHYSSEVYKDLPDPFKPRLFSYLVVAPFIELDQQPAKPGSLGRISAPKFERLVTGWSFVWFLGTLLVFFGLGRPLLYMFGTAVGVSFAYSLQNMVYPYDLPALFFATVAFVVVRHGRLAWLPWVLAVGTGFKETVVVFAFLVWFTDQPRKDRLRALGECLAACFLVIVAIDMYSGRGLLAFEAISTAQDPGDPEGPKILLNLATMLNPASFVWWVNAGLALPLLLLPARDEMARGFRWVGILFATGLFVLAGIGELRIWFELIPFCLHNSIRFLEPGRTVARSTSLEPRAN